MPQVDTGYLVGVIREWEKRFLKDDEYTRLIEAPSYEEAQRVLSETPYRDRDGLERHLSDIRAWFADTLDDDRVLSFISARYDGLNIAACLVYKQRGLNEPEVLSPLGSIKVNSLQSAIWHDLDWEGIPGYWHDFLRTYRQGPHGSIAILQAVALQTLAWQKVLAFTPLMKDIVRLLQQKFESDERVRPFNIQEDDNFAASRRDLAFDEDLLLLLRKHRLEVDGYDPLLAFWFAKETEVRTIRLLLAGRLVGMTHDEIQELKRPSYLAFAW